MLEVELRKELELLRKALQLFWASWAIEKNRPEAATGATMCRFTVAFLSRMLKKPWRVAGGEAWRPGEAAGYFDGKEWHGHYWLTDGLRIVDLTADQFGADAIVITTSTDSRYVANYSKSEMREQLSHVNTRAKQWAKEFSARQFV